MKVVFTSCLFFLLFAAGCSRLSGVTNDHNLRSDFDKKLVCSREAERILKVNGAWYTGEKTYVDQSFYSPKRNSCVAVLILTTGDVTPLPSGELRDTLSDTYDIVDTLSYQVIRHTSSGIGEDRTKASEEIEKELLALKEP